MRIAICAAGEIYGGVERHILGLATRLRDLDHIVFPVLFHRGELSGQLVEAGFHPLIIGDRKAIDFKAVSALSEMIRSHQIDVLHAHGYKSVVTSGQAIKCCRCALTVTMHGMNEPAAGSLLRWLKTRLYGRLETWAIRSTKASVAYVTADIKKSYDALHRDLVRRVIHNGITPMAGMKFPKPAELADDRFHIGIVGRITPVKGIDLAIKALSNSEIPDHVVLDIVGDGPQFSALQALAQQTGAQDRIHFHGHRHDIFDFLAHFDALLMPSLHEGLPYTLLEALSLGIPTLCARVGGLAEILTHNETAILFEKMDIPGISNAIIRIVKDQELYGRIGSQGKHLQETEYSLNLMVDKYISIYKHSLGES